MIVLCLEGCHGSGKTELCRRFEMMGFNILDEAFLDMPSYGLHPQSLLMETTWICSWFQRLLKHANSIKQHGGCHKMTVYIADRSPYSAVLYCHHGQLLRPVIKQQIEEVRSVAEIEIHTVYIHVEHEVLWERIQARLCLEPERVLYKEDKYDWMVTVANFYDSFEWDLEVDNTEEDVSMSLRALMERTIRSVCDSIPKLRDAFESVAPELLAQKKQANREEDSFSSEEEEKRHCITPPYNNACVKTTSHVKGGRIHAEKPIL